MAPRALGALLALAAVVAFAVSIATSAWWAGHPVVNGRPITAKDVHVGLLGAEGCNTGGDGSCEPVAVGTTYKLATYGELAIVGLTALLALALAISTWTVGDRRKGLARATMLMAVLAGAGGGIVFALGPAIKAGQRVDVPIGWGLYVFGGAIAASLLGGAIARTVEREPLRLKPSNAPLQPLQRDVRDMLREQRDGMLHPGSRKSDPRLGHDSGRESVPLFGSAPQLRPLYDPQNQGVVPVPPPPALPRHMPTPLPQQAINALTGMPSPAPRNVSPPADPFAQTPDPFGETDFQQHAQRAESEPIEPPPPVAPPPPERRASPTTPPRMAPETSPPRTSPTTNPPRMTSSTSPPRAPSSTSPPRAPSSTNPPHTSPTNPPSRTSPPTNPPSSSPSNSPRTSPPTNPPSSNSPRTSPPTHPPSSSPSNSPRTSPPTNPPSSPSSSPRPSPPTNPPSSPANTSRTSPPTNPPSSPANSPPTNPPSSPIPSVRPKLPTMPPLGPRTSSTTSPPPGPKTTTMPPPAGPKPTTGAAPPPSLESVQSRSGKKVTVPPPARTTPQPRTSQPTMANAVPPMPNADHQPAPADRSTTDADDRSMDSEVGDRTDAGVAPASASPGDMTDPTAEPPPRPSDTDPQPPPRPSGMTDPSVGSDDAPADTTDETKPPEGMIERNPKAATPLAPPPVAKPPVEAAAPPAVAPAATDAVPQAIKIPISTAPSTLPPPKKTNETASGPQPACPQCEAPMAWVDEHLRFYCKSCRMYF